MAHLTPHHLNRRHWLLGSAAALAWPPAPAGASLLTPALDITHPGDTLRPRELRFPRDHGTHNDTRTEWWYLTGHARDDAGRDFGFQITFFRSRVDEARDLPGRLAARQLLFAHAAITDVAGRRLHHDERIARWNGQRPAHTERAVFASESDTEVVLRDWFIRRRADGGYATRAVGDTLLIDIEASAPQAWLLQGDRGFSRKGPDAAQSSFYVSQPQLQVRGTLGLAGQRVAITGTAWLDHEWSEALLHPEAVGWDWIGMNLFDGHALTAFRLRRADGSTVWTGGSFRAAADARDPNAIHRFAPGEVEFKPRRWWTSPLTNTRYPVEWLVRTPADFYTVRALIDAQELDSRASTGAIYWEGLSDLIDSNGRAVGDTLLIDIEASTPQAWLLQGDRGFSRKGPDAAQSSFYVSQPQLQVRGTLGLAGRRFAITGTAWLDHEWSEALLHPEAVGWDWIGMNLFDGHALTAFRLRRADGSTLWTGGSFRAAGDARDPNAIHRFAPGEVEFKPQRWWTSPLTNTRYPVEWLVRTPADFYTVRALIDAQELDSRASTGAIYWEGLSDLIDSNGRTVGRGYLEMTGYAKRLVL